MTKQSHTTPSRAFPLPYQSHIHPLAACVSALCEDLQTDDDEAHADAVDKLEHLVPVLMHETPHSRDEFRVKAAALVRVIAARWSEEDEHHPFVLEVKEILHLDLQSVGGSPC
ncbi:hypothetical protein [Methylocystis sp. ATCC 49242]|uniref:hypothetical protein n=1 Tax=Methylocystis sp. ATCC 49242 TaxID=622637 RepID=UPI0011850779|nr:hypothetical protein [Methylocystis sp. ATCC 49242]